MIINKYILVFLLLSLSIIAKAETTDSITHRFNLGLEYTGELQSDFGKGINFLNHLRLDASLNVSNNFSIDISTISVAKTRENLINDQQAFSNIETEDNIPLTLAVAGVSYTMPTEKGTHTLFAGLRNTGEDYFASDMSSFFINSSCGIFPTISANFPIATFPCSAMSLHYSFDSEHWGAKATIYNGEGNYRFSGRNNMFRICPQSDGIFAMAQGEYKTGGSSYFLGGSLYKHSPTLWTYAEQKIFQRATSDLSIIAAYSHCLDRDTDCRNFAGIGALMSIRDIEIGVFTDYADYQESDEYATELSVSIPLCKYAYIKPSLHYIKGNGLNDLVSLLRFGIVL